MGVPFRTPAPDIHLYSDASRSGWGAHLLDRSVFRGVVSAGEFSAHQSPGDEGLISGSTVLPGDGHGSPCDRDVRQLDGGCLHQQARRYSVRLPLLVDQATSPMGRVLRCPVGGELSAGTVQCSGRPPQPSGAGYRVQVVSPSPGGESTPSCLEFSVAGLVRDTPQRKASPVLLPRPGSSGHLRGCVPTSVGQAGRVCFSSLSPGREGCGSSQRPQISPKDWLALFGRRRGGLRTTFCWPNHLWRYPSGTGCFGNPTEPSRMATLKRLLWKSGFSQGAALEMSGYIRESTARLYQAKWLSFCGCCRVRGVAPVNATIPLIVDFFIHLRRDKGLSVSVIKGYRATLNSVLTLKGLDLSTSRELSMLFRSFSRSVPHGELWPPAWDVALVL